MKIDEVKKMIEDFVNRKEVTLYVCERYFGSSKARSGQIRCVNPEHNDNNPSGVIYNDGHYYCFACKTYKRNAISLLMSYHDEFKSSNYWPLAERIARETGYTGPGLDEAEVIIDNASPQYLAAIAKYNSLEKIVAELSEKTIREGANDYLASRGISARTAKKMKLFYCLTHDDYHDGAIDQLWYDQNNNVRFYGRLGIPIFDSCGHIRGLTARTLPTFEKGAKECPFYSDLDKAEVERVSQMPKYLNSPMFKKEKFLYNFHNAKKHKTIYIVEGLFDALSLIEIGMDNVVALMGCDISDEQLQLLKGKELILCLDNDKEKGRDIPGGAGNAAMVQIINKYKNQIKFKILYRLNSQYKDFNDCLVGMGRNEFLKFMSSESSCIPAPVWYIMLCNVRRSLNENVEQNTWLGLMKLIGPKPGDELAYRNRYRVNSLYSPWERNTIWAIYDEVICGKSQDESQGGGQ